MITPVVIRWVYILVLAIVVVLGLFLFVAGETAGERIGG
jgi:hypothetical protein